MSKAVKDVPHLITKSVTFSSEDFIFLLIPSHTYSNVSVFVFIIFFIFPLYSKGIKLSLHVYITITFFPPSFLLLQHEYLEKVLNAIQQDLLINLF